MESIFEKNIQDAHDAINLRADDVIIQNMTTFRQNISATIEYELVMIKRDTREGDILEAKYHKLMASIYQSILDRV